MVARGEISFGSPSKMVEPTGELHAMLHRAKGRKVVATPVDFFGPPPRSRCALPNAEGFFGRG